MSMVVFGTGRGRKAHLIREQTLDNLNKVSACGVPIDTVLDKRFIDADEFCGNCERTTAYKDISANHSIH